MYRKMNNRAGTVLEVIWFVMGGFFLFIGVGEVMDTGFGENWYYLAFSLLAFVMYYRRRRMRLSGK